jgi:hypothetical protein
MASVKRLKKDIDDLLFEVVSDCFTFKEVHPDKKQDEISSILSDAISLRNDLIARANNPDGKDNPKIIRAYYKAIEKDLITGADKLFSRLSSISGKSS